MSATPHPRSPKIDAVHQISITGQQQPESEQLSIENIETTENAICTDSFNEATEETAALLPESSPPRNKRSSPPSTPSSNTSHAASLTSSRYSPISSASRTPPSVSSYEPLSPPSSSEMRRRRKLAPPVPFHACSSLDNTISIQKGEDYSHINSSEVITVKMKANEQRHDQQQRLRHILQQNFTNHEHIEEDQTSTAGACSCVSSKTSSTNPRYNLEFDYSNVEHCHEHEIVINSESLEGTIESASFHLHGQTGGRVKSESPDLKNTAVMNVFALQNVIDTEESSMSDALEDTVQTNIKIDLENGGKVISNKERNFVDDDHHEDIWSTGIAAAVVMGTASRYHKTFFMFPHGQRVILPIIVGMLALCLSIVTLKSCRFLTVLPNDNSQVFELGPWSYLSPGGIYDGEVCLPYPSGIEVDTPFMAARIVSVLATCLGGGLLLLTATMMCIPHSNASISFLGLGYIFAGILQALTMVHYQTNNCKGGGYFRGFECKPNQDLVFCLAASALYLACGWILLMLQKFAVAPPGHSTSQIYTCSAKSNSSDESKGILRTVEKSWTKIPSGETLVATVFVERLKESDGTTKTKHSIKTELIDY